MRLERKNNLPLQDQWSKNGLQLLMEDAGSLSKLLDASWERGFDVDSPLMTAERSLNKVSACTTPVAQRNEEKCHGLMS